MKAKLNEPQEQQFNPIELTLKIESRRELETLMLIFGNITPYDFAEVVNKEKQYKKIPKIAPVDISNATKGIFNILDEHYKFLPQHK